MKIVYNQSITEPYQRVDIAKIVSRITSGSADSQLPYKPNLHDDSFWTLDSGNDWKLKFLDDGVSIEIRHRYFDTDMTEILSKWIAYRTNGKFEKGV